MAALATLAVGLALFAHSSGFGSQRSPSRAKSGEERVDSAEPGLIPFPELREAFRGKVVLMHFWASWCGHCAAELPHLKEIHRRFQGREFEVVGVCLDVGPPRYANRWLRRHRVPWRQIFDGRRYRGELSRRLQVAAPPASLLLDREGRILARNLPPEMLHEAVRQALEAEGASDVDEAPRRRFPRGNRGIDR